MPFIAEQAGAGGPAHAPPALRERASTAAEPPTLTVHLLGPLRVAIDGTPVRRWPSGRGRSLFKYLLTHRHPWPQREALMEAFWPASTPEAARNSLNVALHGLRRALRVATDLPVVVREEGSYRVHPGLRLWVDVDEFEAHVLAGRRLEAAGAPDEAVAEYELAAVLYQGDLLADDPYEEWPVLARERLRLAYLDTLDRLSELYLGQGRLAACAALCRRVIERDACREDAHRRLMRCYGRQRQPHLALRQYHACAAALAAELDVGPAPATTRLYEAIRRHEPV
jgi:DNA-binding SARP family transcriptional activator